MALDRGPGGGAGPGASEAWPRLRTPLSPAGVLERLGQLSKRGKLAGFEVGVGAGAGAGAAAGAGAGASGLSVGRLCSVAAFGTPFDHALDLYAETGDGGTWVRFSLRLRRRTPWVFAAILIISVWPGEPVTDSLLRAYLGFYARWTNPEVASTWLRTWMWYYPLAVPGAVLAWGGAMRRSELTSRASAAEVIEKIARAIDGAIDGAADGGSGGG